MIVVEKLPIFFGCAAAALIACGGRTDEQYGLEAPTSEPQADVAYPSGDFGYNVGNVVPNLAFVGYEHLDPTTVIGGRTKVGTVRFADFYDPAGERGLTYLYVSVQYVWCGVSNEQDDLTTGANWTGANTDKESFAMEYATKGVRFMTLLADGPNPGTNATVFDLMSWVRHHEARISEGLLPHDELSLEVLGAAAPYNMIVDLRTMRVVNVEVGFEYDMKTLASLF